jgi:hypothetical protein
MKLKMKFFLVFAVAVTFCSFSANCMEANSPSGIVQAFIDYFLKGDFEKLADHVIAYMDGDEEDIADKLRDLEKRMNSEDYINDVKDFSFEIISENISDDGNNATVKIKVVDKSGKKTKEELIEMRVVKKGRVWKMDFEGHDV